ncbi:MAG: helix-turn-helix domain-containing protein [Prevotellaceae bacterium]|jgi:AraC-like DNA-binding protein|nr:helix-turn-helix domain-containing protein [Prevotellaceae bacterium]
MNYQEHSPDSRLMPFIEAYWTTSGFIENENASKILPDGCVDIIFTFDESANAFRSEIIGTMTTFIKVICPQSVRMFGIRFKPVGITAFTRVPVEEFTDRNIELAPVESLFDTSWDEALPEQHSTEAIINYVNNYLISRLSRLYLPDKRIVRAVDLICLAKGQLSLSAVAAEVCLCQRHFERKFKSATGISPKMFAKVVRFKQALRHLRNYPHKDLLSIAIECGYYDHTHLIKEIKTFSGDTPAGFRP